MGHSVSPVLIISLICISGSFFFLALATTHNSHSNFDQLAGQVGHGFFSDVLGESLPVYNIEHISSVIKAGDAEKTKNFKINPGFISTDNTCEMCLRVEYSPAAVQRAAFAFKFDKPSDLSGAQRLVFFAKGEKGGETLTIVAIGKNSQPELRRNLEKVVPQKAQDSFFKNLDFEVITKNVTLNKDWNRYQIALNGTNLQKTIAPFGIVIHKDQSKVMDSIKANKAKLERPPVESTKGKVVFFLKGITIDSNPPTQALPISKNQVADVIPFTVNITSTPALPTVNQSVVFDANVVGGVAPYLFKWNFGEANEKTVIGNRIESHSYQTGGPYRAEVVVNDSSVPPRIAQSNVNVSVISANQTTVDETISNQTNQSKPHVSIPVDETTSNQTNQTKPQVSIPVDETISNQTNQTRPQLNPKSNTNNSPIASDGHQSIPSNKPAQIQLVAVDPDNDPITFTIISSPSHGVLAGLNERTGVVSYVPDPSFNGKDAFSFKAVDIHGVESKIAKLKLTLDTELSNDEAQQRTIPTTNMNSTESARDTTPTGEDNAVSNKQTGDKLRPAAFSQVMQTEQNRKLAITLKAKTNDEHNLVFAILENPSNGKLSSFSKSTGMITYTPDIDFTGIDKFTFKVMNEEGVSSRESQITIRVNPNLQGSISDMKKTDDVDRLTTQDRDSEIPRESISPSTNPPDSKRDEFGKDGGTSYEPKANAGEDQVVNELSVVALEAEKNGENGNTLISYNWNQLEGPPVKVGDSRGPKIMFLAPEVKSDTTIVFQVTVSSDLGKSSTDEVNIKILDTVKDLGAR